MRLFDKNKVVKRACNAFKFTIGYKFFLGLVSMKQKIWKNKNMVLGGLEPPTFGS